MKTCWYKYGISMNNFGLFFFNLKDFRNDNPKFYF